jgi:hypothetical protein
VKAPANCRLIGRWRIVEADLWDRAHLDLCGPARLTITAQDGEIAFAALEAGLEVEYARDSIGFHWAGCEEGDQVEGEGTAELLDDGTLEIEFAYRNGDEAVLKAKRDTSSTVLIPGFDGAILSCEWRDALWARFFTGAPQRQRRSVERYNIVKRA